MSRRHRRAEHVHILGSQAEPTLAQVERGIAAESRLVALLERALADRTDCPNWIHSVSLGEIANDGQGIDVIVMADVGPLFIQVKSSEFYRHHFIFVQHLRNLRGLRNQPIGVVVVNESKTDAQVLGQVYERLNRLRQNQLKHGRSYCDRQLLTSDD